MNIPNALMEEIKLYLKHQADTGDLEAQILLGQMQQVTSTQSATSQSTVSDPSLKDVELGC